MHIFPYKEYAIETSMQKSVAVDRLIHHTKAKSGWKLPNREQFFIGEVYEDGFDLILRMLSISYSHRYYRPKIHGSIRQDGDITKIQMSIRTSWLTKFIILLVSAMFFISAVTQYSDTETFYVLLGFGVFALLANLGAVHLYFKSYIKRGLKWMEQIYKENDSEHYLIYEMKNKKYENSEDSI